MLTSLEQLRKFKLQATDGEIGRVRDVLIEEGNWTARWLVADTGDWLLGKKVLLSPHALKEPDMENEVVPVAMDKAQIESSPHLDEDAPVTREYEKSLFDQYEWPYYWHGGLLWGQMDHPTSLRLSSQTDKETELDPPPSSESEDHPLRSGHEVTKYQLVSNGKVFGFMEDVIMDTSDWTVKYLQIDTRKWFHGLTLHVSPEKITGISWPDHEIYTDIGEEELEAVKSQAKKKNGSPDSKIGMNSLVLAHYGVILPFVE